MHKQPSLSRLLAVVVVYERGLDDVMSWQFLRQRLAVDAARTGAAETRGFVLAQVMIYDNSPRPRAQPLVPVLGCTYLNDVGNGGTAAAYERASAMAGQAGIDWLLLLDHDTVLPDGFLEAASTALASQPLPARALVPWVFHGTVVVSPARVTDAGTIAPLAYQARLPAAGRLTAISSGSLVHAPTLATLLPLPAGLWLDYVDHWIFTQLRSRGLPVAVFDASLQHELSILAIESLSPRRLTSILDGEAAFQTKLGLKARLVYPLRLAARVLRYARVRPELARHTLAWIAHRIRCRT